VVTIPPADRSASPQLIRAAEAVNFHPFTAPGVGKIEDAPAAAGTKPSSDLLAVGTKAPAFTLRTPTGKKVSLSDYRGKALLLEFYAGWCPHCAAEAPHLRALAGRLPASKAALLAVNGDGEDAPSVFAYHVYFGLPFPALLDPAPGKDPVTFPTHGPVGRISTAYKVGYFPTFYVIDPQGRIAWRGDGEQPDALLRQQLLRAAGT
jgi:peroxiredoxin